MKCYYMLFLISLIQGKLKFGKVVLEQIIYFCYRVFPQKTITQNVYMMEFFDVISIFGDQKQKKSLFAFQQQIRHKIFVNLMDKTRDSKGSLIIYQVMSSERSSNNFSKNRHSRRWCKSVHIFANWRKPLIWQHSAWVYSFFLII